MVCQLNIGRRQEAHPYTMKQKMWKSSLSLGIDLDKHLLALWNLLEKLELWRLARHQVLDGVI
jgi:hypothetical protein